MNEVVLAVNFSISNFFLPDNPKRKTYLGDDGALMFQPDLSNYADIGIRPVVSGLVTGVDYLKSQADRIRERGLGLTTWIIYAPNDCLARSYPEWTTKDALGNLYPTHLCISAPDVRSYFLALTENVVEHALAPVPDGPVHVRPLRRQDFQQRVGRVIAPSRCRGVPRDGFGEVAQRQ